MENKIETAKMNESNNHIGEFILTLQIWNEEVNSSQHGGQVLQ